MLPLANHTIFLTLAGSQAHGTARAGSDVDLRGICIAPLPLRLSIFRGFEYYEGALPEGLAASVLPRIQAHPTASRALQIECAIFDITKFVSLCTAANPNTLEILFADKRDWVFETPAWRILHENRRRFLTKKIGQTFLGYAMAQLKRIQTHRSWLLNPPTKKPSRTDFGLPVAGGTLNRDDQDRIDRHIADKIRSYRIDDVEMPKPSRVALQERMASFYRDVLSAAPEEIEERMQAVASHALRLPLDAVTALNAEKKYRAAMKHWESYQSWKQQRNPARAAVERTYGYDTKHAMHLIRLMRMGLEALQTGDLRVRRDDASELGSILDGALTFEELLSKATAMKESLERAEETTPLPAEVDEDEVDALLLALVRGEGPCC